ncbi:hypothetical protein [Actinacidiphila bryophytorum]|uniref:hypothetical protein n=1 Tax=Actinacidiphila bryophytorum TaxID=1436133 RepID=UPI002176B080|nr:hypothetical protein [Actinacidiphila bryophytorum]UWE12408.1 hypothetical protein NYE86_29470 [Actinacidiphila bryophytorum]
MLARTATVTSDGVIKASIVEADDAAHERADTVWTKSGELLGTAVYPDTCTDLVGLPLTGCTVAEERGEQSAEAGSAGQRPPRREPPRVR